MPDATDPVLDASAVLAVIFGETGADRVAEHLPGARISAVNAAEVMTKLVDLGMPEDTVDTIFEGLQLTVVPFEITHARESARLKALTRATGLSLGDRVCLAVAGQLAAPAFTTDRAWSRLDSTSVGVAVELLR
ncbi:type II toxin-antitoxin system VapC family toxin [Methylobacterium aquaticum]|uniref:Twitching motility protein PilT n=1 Tax=Methylobacterium aquaticum TaxID=270351 RepID=A0A0J6T1A0_9HYPH|nr:type II toxin-antitoxin system VapC family toxin [Methylobacterium aquaticum]KMO39363.1 twitching motility protein PilT [Methylobacterium aquaticum]